MIPWMIHDHMFNPSLPITCNRHGCQGRSDPRETINYTVGRRVLFNKPTRNGPYVPNYTLDYIHTRIGRRLAFTVTGYPFA